MSKKLQPPVIESMEPRLFFDASALTETIVGKSLPASITNAKLAHGNVSVRVTNTSGTAQAGPVQVGVFAASGALVVSSGQFVILGSRGLALSLKNGQSKVFAVSVTIKPDELALGAETLFGVVVDPANAFSQSATGPTLTITKPPPPVFSETILAATPHYTPDPVNSSAEFADQISLKLSIRNKGAASKGTDTFKLFISSTPAFDPPATLLTSDSMPLSIGHNGSRKLLLSFQTANLGDGSTSEIDRYLFVQVTDTAGDVTLAGFPTQVKLAGPKG